jgi:hypothetical protein
MKFTNQTHIEGLLYDHDLKERTTGENSKNPGVDYINGKIRIATDDNITNIVDVNFTYVTQTTQKGKPNATYAFLKGVIDKTHPTVADAGADKAKKVRIDSALGLNEFYTANRNDNNGEPELVSVKRNEGGFIHITNDLNPNESLRNTFKTDFLITGTKLIEADPERELPEKLKIKGVIFDFKGAILPVEFSAIHPDAIQYFEGLGASNKEPVFTQVWGNQISTSIMKRTVVKSAFGPDQVNETPVSDKDFIITGAKPEPYAWDDENTITAADLTEKMTDRQTYLATLKSNYLEYQDKKNKPQASAFANAAPTGFNF